MPNTVLDLLQFYQSEIREHPDAQTLLKQLGITSPEVIEHFHIGYSSGKGLEIASDEDKALLRKVGLANRTNEAFKGCLVVPVYDGQQQLVDMFGIRVWGKQRHYQRWQSPPKGLIGADALPVYPEIVLCDDVFTALHVRQHGYLNVVTLRRESELKNHLSAFEAHNIERVYVASRKHRKRLEPPLKKRGLEVVVLPYPSNQSVIGKECLQVVGKASAKKASAALQVIARSETRIHFAAGSVNYRIESTALSGLGMRVQIRAEREKISFLDRVDLASSSARTKFAKHCAGRVGLSSREVENHLNQIADEIDRVMLEEAEQQTRTPRALSAKEEQQAIRLLKQKDLLEIQAKAIAEHCGIIGEESNKKLAILIAASRLLPKPLGGILRGSPSSGKSSLIRAVATLLPPSETMFLSRLTSASLYYMRKEDLHHKLLIIDEWEGLADTEYPVRSMMSSQLLSIAVTSREGGRTPSTRIIEIPATLALLVSATHPVNIENLSRFLELRMDSSPEQTTRVLQGLAASQANGKSADDDDLQLIRNANQLLQPVRVVTPYAKKLVYGTSSVFARRQFEQIAGLIQASAALCQFQRKMESGKGLPLVEASVEDYAVVHGLLPAIIDHMEEELSPASVELLDRIKQDCIESITVKQVMGLMAWSYSKTFRILRELVAMNLMVPDMSMVGVERVYDPAPYVRMDRGLTNLPDPQSL